MKVKCEYCGSYIDETAEKCESCGAVNLHQMRSGDGVPKTIAELLAFAHSKNLPLQDMRFFIGEDYREPRAFGIYKDEGSGNFVVYKNKSDGSRIIRYQGTDEAYAVNELYQKMRSEVMEQKAKGPAKKMGKVPTAEDHAKYSQIPKGAKRKTHNKNRIGLIIFVVVAIIGIALSVAGFGDSSSSSYSDNSYTYEDSYDSDGSYDSNYDSNYDSGGSTYDSWADDWDDDDLDWSSGDSWDSGGSDWDSDW